MAGGRDSGRGSGSDDGGRGDGRGLWRVELLGGLRAAYFPAPDAPEPTHSVERFQTQRTGLLLAALSLDVTSGSARPRDEIAGRLWPDAEPGAARERLSQALYWLRQRLEGDAGLPPGSVLIADRHAVRLAPEAAETDVSRFERAVAGGRWEEAVRAYAGPLLAGYPDDEWVYLERQRLAETYRGALRSAAAAADAARRPGDAAAYLRLALREDPLDETVVADLMRLLARQGSVSAALREYRALGERLRETFDEDASPALQDLAQSLRQQTPAAAADAAATPPPSPSPSPGTAAEEAAPVAGQGALPPALTRFFGREAEIAAVIAALTRGEARLISLLGPGGSGKTRLAVEVARRLPPERFAPVFVPLENVPDARRLLPALYQAVSPPGEPRREDAQGMWDFLARRLACGGPGEGGAPPRRTLLLLDNAEHLAEEEGTGDLLRELFARCPALCVLVTARRALDLEGESRVMVTPLPVPPASVPPLPAGAREYREEGDPLWEYASVRLFADRARQARFDFALSPENRETVAALCAKLEGIPLAIELCAAWAATLSPDQMLADLTSRFDLLVSRRRDLPERHRTLRAAVESSFLQLPPDLRATFALLSVFRGGWTGEAAEAVQPPDGGGHAAARDRLAQLYERSLILAEESPRAGGAGGAALRYRMLDTLREFAGDQLTDAERRRAAARHAAYYLALAEEASAHLSGPDQRRHFDLLESEHENLRAALGRLRAQAANPALGASERREAARSGLRLATALARYWQVRGHSAEGRDWLEGFLPAPDGGPAAAATAGPGREEEEGAGEDEARGHSEAGRLAWAQSDYAAALRHQEAALRLWRGVGRAAGIAEALLDLGTIAYRQGRLDDARPLLEESLRTARDAGDDLTTAGALLNLGNIASEGRDYARARELYGESLRIARAAGERRRVAAALNNLGNVARHLGDFAAATHYQEETLALRRELGDRSGCATSLLNLAEIARQQGLWDRAGALLAESLRAQRELGDPFAVSECLLVFAGVAGGAGDFARSATLLGAARAVRAAIGSDLSPSDRERWEGFAEAARAALGAAEFASVRARGERLSLAEAVAFALERHGDAAGGAAATEGVEGN